MRKIQNEVCEMREQGLSFQEIGKRLGVSKQYAYDVFSYATRTGYISYKQFDMIDSLKFKGIKNWMIENGVTLKEMNGKCTGVYNTNSSLVRFLRGSGKADIETINKILEVTGMKYEEAFT